MRYSVPAIEKFFHYLATLRWLGGKIILEGYKPDAQETEETNEDLRRLFSIGNDHGLKDNEIARLICNDIFWRQTV